MHASLWTKPIDYLHIENIEFDGTRTFDRPTSRLVGGTNLSHKCLATDDQCRRIYMRNVTMRNWGGEIYYAGGNSVLREEYLENCTFDGSPQAVFNPGTAARGTYINLRAGNGHQIELMGGAGKDFIGGLLYDLGAVGIMGGAAGGDNGVAGGPHFAYPQRKTTGSAPYSTFSGGFAAERCGHFELGSYIRGEIKLVDTYLGFSPRLGALSDVDLRVTSVLDRAVMTEALSIGGIENLTTPIREDDPATGEDESRWKYQPPCNVNIDLTCIRTRLAQDEQRMFHYAVAADTRLYDAKSVKITVRGNAASRPFLFRNPPVPGFVYPHMVLAPDFTSTHWDGGLVQYYNPDGSAEITLWPGVTGIEPVSNKLHTVTVNNTSGGYVDGQEASIAHAGPSGRVVRLPASPGLLLSQERYLINQGDRLNLRWSTARNAWMEVGYSTSAVLAMSGSAVYEAPKVPSGGSTSTTVRVPGARVGDIVSALSFGAIDLQGLMARAEVTGDDTVTVWLTNLTAATVGLPSARLRLQVTKAFAD